MQVPTEPAPSLSVLAPGTRYDASIPTLEDVVGHDFGDELSTHSQIAQYLRALHEAAPGRTRLVEYATSWEGRRLYVLVIANQERMTRLDAVQADVRRLALVEADADTLVESLPVVSWFAHSVHGDELSSSDAALAEAYHLLAAVGDTDVDLILRESIVIIDPLQNPDGRERFIFNNLMARGYPPDTLPVAAEHDETWPSGRVNHYLFDLNRDWIVQSQREAAGRGRLWLEWMPHVSVDLHEMGGVAGITPRATYYFPPPAPPENPYLSDSQVQLLERIGRANAERFDARGFPYFTREVFGGYFPGAAAGWPLSQGGLGMTFEKASAHGLGYRRVDGTVLTYRDGVVEHFTAALETMKTAALERETILRSFVAFRRDAIERGGQAGYLIPPVEDRALHYRLADTLRSNGIDVRAADEDFEVSDTTYPAGTLMIPLAQPAGRMARNLIETDISMPDDYLELQMERRAKNYPAQVYDISAWSLPLLYDIDAVFVDDLPPVTASAPAAPRATTLPDARVAYLLPWNVTTARTVAEALRTGITVRVANEPFVLNGRTFGVGTAIVRVPDHDAGLADTLGTIAGRHGAEVVAANTGFVDSGISLGSNQVRPLKAPRVLLAWDVPTDSYSAGWTRFVLERHFGQPVSLVRVASVPKVPLSSFDVIVLPAGDYTSIAPPDFAEQLRAWMHDGGILVTLSDASRWAAAAGLVASEAGLTPARTPGALARVMLDTQHWLSAGTDGEIQMLVNGRRMLSPVSLEVGVNAGVYAEADRLRASGLIWDDVRDTLAGTAAIIFQRAGRGGIVAFAEDPNYRAYDEASMLLFINAVLIGPAHLPVPGVE